MIASAVDDWRALFAINGVLMSRKIALWGGNEGSPCGIVVNEQGMLRAASTLPGFVGYAAPDDDPNQIFRAHERAEEAEQHAES